MDQRCPPDGQADAVSHFPGARLGRAGERLCPIKRRRLRVGHEAGSRTALPRPGSGERQTWNQRAHVGRFRLLYQVIDHGSRSRIHPLQFSPINLIARLFVGEVRKRLPFFFPCLMRKILQPNFSFISLFLDLGSQSFFLCERFHFFFLVDILF